jgi:hypothetical protein
MKTIKGLLLGAAAALSMGSVASAADLPAAEPVEYVRVCDAYGAGYFFIPGTDTCLRISGYVRVQAYYHDDNSAIPNWTGFATDLIAPTYNPTTGVWTQLSSPTVDQLDMGVRALLRFDARSRTDWGVLRSFFEFAANSATNAVNGSALQIRYGFVQFGAFTVGLTDSFFNFDNGSYYGDVVGDRTTRSVVVAYTAAFGNGFSATVSLEDPGASLGVGGALGGTTSVGGGTGTLGLFTSGLPANLRAVNGSTELPDLVGNIRVSQAWGTAQLSGVVAQRRIYTATCYSVGVLTGECEDDKTAWAIKGGVRVNLDMLSRGSNINFQATYGEGASNFVFTGSNTGYWQSGAAFSPTGLRLNNSEFNDIKSWSLFGQFQYFFTPAIRGTLYAGYADVDPDGDLGLAPTGASLVYLKETWQIGGQIQWTPVRNLDLGLDVFYTRGEYEAVRGITVTGTTVSTAPGLGTVSSESDEGWGAIFRVQRSF